LTGESLGRVFWEKFCLKDWDEFFLVLLPVSLLILPSRQISGWNLDEFWVNSVGIQLDFWSEKCQSFIIYFLGNQISMILG
jgi:hypothetical protein